jgi:hypothetical protein
VLVALVQSAQRVVRVAVALSGQTELLVQQAKATLAATEQQAQTTQTAAAVAVLALLAPMLLRTHKVALVEMAWLRASQALQ